MNSGSPLDDPQSFCRASPPTRLIDVLRLALALGLAEVMGKLVPSKSFRPTADRLLSVVASFILLFLIGCAPRLQANSACPSTVVLRPLASTAIFGPAAVGHPDNVAFYGYLGQVSSNCAYTGDAVQITLDVPVVGERGPVATGQTVDLQFFVAVTGPDQKILSKRPFAARIAFEGVQNRAGVTDHIEETIPLGGRNGSDLNVLLGFQQGPQVVEFYKRFQGRTAEMQPLALPEAPLGTAVGETVRLERRDGGYFVPVRINQTITLPFLLDTGASDLVIPADVALTLIRAGAPTSGDFIGKSRYRLANGSEEVSDLVVLREVQVGEHAIRNVTASISPVRGEPLLGQSFLSKFGTVTLDYKRLVLILSR